MIEASANKLRKWMKAVTLSGSMVFNKPIEGAVILICIFYLKKPKTVKRDIPHVKPDLDKLIRAINDSLIGVAFRDDSQVVHIEARKVYSTASEQGCFIRIMQHGGDGR